MTILVTGATGSIGRLVVDHLPAIGAVLGRPVEFVRVSAGEAVEILEPVMGANARFYIDTAVASLVGAPQPATDTVAAVTGRGGTTFAEWAAANAGAFT
ncbi:hypothetical protein [Rhodococcus sp. NPDC059234]|uniref:hypothetical protein n=1 Tax=Rhodococcus sp. NPDC059234 TaxID=3346781 RepID=UPI00366ABA85